MNNFETFEDAMNWYEQLPWWKRLWFTIRFYPRWPFTIQNKLYIDIGKLNVG